MWVCGAIRSLNYLIQCRFLTISLLKCSYQFQYFDLCLQNFLFKLERNQELGNIVWVYPQWLLYPLQSTKLKTKNTYTIHLQWFAKFYRLAIGLIISLIAEVVLLNVRILLDCVRYSILHYKGKKSHWLNYTLAEFVGANSLKFLGEY